MRRNQLFINIISLLLSLGIVLTVGAVTAFAEPEDGEAQQEIISEEDQPLQETPQDTAETPETPQTPQEAVPEETPQEQPAEEPTYAPIYEYIGGYSEDAQSNYEEPQYLGELPQVSAGEVIEATAVVIPDVAVSDASLFSGIVMWLCVALGIAVVVGVLVSKRTRRRGA